MDIFKVKDINDLKYVNYSEVAAVVGLDDTGNIVLGDNELLTDAVNIIIDEFGDGTTTILAAEYGLEGISEVSVDASTYGLRRYSEGYDTGYADGTSLVFEENKYGIVGYFNDWGNKPDTYFEDYGTIDVLNPYKALVVRNFYCDGTEIKIRYNNSWDESYNADLYNEPQLCRLNMSDSNIQLSEGYWDIYLLGMSMEEEDGSSTFFPVYLLVLNAGQEIPELCGSITFKIDSDYKSWKWSFYQDFDEAGSNTSGNPVSFQYVWYGNTLEVKYRFGTFDYLEYILDWRGQTEITLPVPDGYIP